MLSVGLAGNGASPNRYRIAALELGSSRVQVVVSPGVEASGQDFQAFSQALLTKGLKIEVSGALVVDGDLLKKLIEVAEGRVSAVGDGLAAKNKQISEAKTLFMSWLENAVQVGATDIHLLPVSSERGAVLFRVDGELEPYRGERGHVYALQEMTQAGAWPFTSVVAKRSNSSSTFESSLDQFCMTEPIQTADGKVVLRYQSLHGLHGPKIVCRILHNDVSRPSMTFGDMGYEVSQQRILAAAQHVESGMIIVAGVTGSGKTTMLKSFVEFHPSNPPEGPTAAFLSIEDPPEYDMRGVHRTPVQRDPADPESGRRSFNGIAAAVVRQDPDIVIVGEMRDEPSASLAMQLTETGHGAYATLHAHLLAGIPPRLTNKEIGLSRDSLTNPNTLTLLVYQALVPKLCPHCKMTSISALAAAEAFDRVDPATRFSAYHLKDIYKRLEGDFNLGMERFFFKNPEGCSHCGGRGTKGVTVVAEMFMPDRTWLELIRNGQDREAELYFRAGVDRSGNAGWDSDEMSGKTVFEHTLLKALRGQVDVRQCERFSPFSQFEVNPQFKPSMIRR